MNKGPKKNQAQGQAPDPKKTIPLGGFLRAKPASQNQSTQAEEDKKLLYLRMVLHDAIKKVFDDTWNCPEQSDIQNRTNDTFEIRKKASPNDGCVFKLDKSLAAFALLSLQPDSREALRKCVGAYVEAYQKWCIYTQKQANLEFELTVYDINQIKPILAVLDALKQPLTEITVVDPQTKEKQKLTAEQIDSFRDQPKENENTKKAKV